MRHIAMFIASQKGWYSLKRAIEGGYAQKIKLVATFKEIDVEKSYDQEIMALCREYEIPCYLWGEQIKESLLQTLIDLEIDIAFAVSWRFLINTEVNQVIKYGLVVFHDSLLPKYRGFAPTPTAIMCGEDKVGVTAILAADKVDEGDIILQKEIPVGENDYISDVIAKEARICGDMVVEILQKAADDSITPMKQDHSAATYSIWRNVEDCKIDWNKTSVEIRNMIRAVSSPYPGAYFFYQKRKVIVKSAEIMGEMNFAVRQPGKIWQIANNCPMVICGRGMLKIIDAEYEDGSKVMFNRLRENLNK